MKSPLLVLALLLASRLASASDQMIAWDAPAAVSGITITGYSLQQCLVPVDATTCQPVDGVGGAPLPVTPRTFTLTGLLPTRLYCLTGVTVGSVTLGTGTATARSAQSTPPFCFAAPAALPAAPLPPQNLRAGGS